MVFQHIIYLAKRFGDGYKKLIDWSLEFKNIKTNSEYEKIVYIISQFTKNTIPEIEAYSEDIYKTVNDFHAESHKYSSENPKKVTMVLDLTAPDTTLLNEEFARLTNKLKLKKLSDATKFI